jgi:hypothetical protein
LTQDQLRARNNFVSNRVERVPAAPAAVQAQAR